MYEHKDGIRASFAKGIVVNNSLKVDATLLSATSNEGWGTLIDDFDICGSFPSLDSLIGIYGDMVGVKISPTRDAKDNYDILAVSYKLHSVSVFHAHCHSDEEAILFNNIGLQPSQEINTDHIAVVYNLAVHGISQTIVDDYSIDSLLSALNIPDDSALVLRFDDDRHSEMHVSNGLFRLSSDDEEFIYSWCRLMYDKGHLIFMPSNTERHNVAFALQ